MCCARWDFRDDAAARTLRIGIGRFTSAADIDYAAAALAAAHARAAPHARRPRPDPTMPKMTFIERDGTRREVDAPLGLSVLEIAHKHGVDIEGACEGSLACSTCHVIVDPAWFGKLATPTEDEEDMLDLAFGLDQDLAAGLPDRDDRGAGRAGGEAAGRHPQHADGIAAERDAGRGRHVRRRGQQRRRRPAGTRPGTR